MFTGIITHLGTVTKKTDTSLDISASDDLMSALTMGTSISVNGICLTVVGKNKDTFTIEFMEETKRKTNIGELTTGNIVNLELPATAQSLLSGHIVQGHVDTTGEIVDIKEDGNSWIFRFKISPEWMRYIVPKGSIAINGISLTVVDVTENTLSIGIIPHTWTHTMLHTTKPGDQLNVEVDVLAKYIEKLLNPRI
jgi:riboflavin synthase